MDKLNVAVLGATGAVGQRFIQLLADHPWFRVAEVVGSERSAGQMYGQVVNWALEGQPSPRIMDMVVKGMDEPLDSQLVFSALPKEPAVEREPALAAAGHVVCTNASAHRMAEDVPLLLPEVNAEHVALIDVQRERRGWVTGALVANANCTTMPVVMALKPLLQFGVKKVHMVSEQAVSGAGYPGVASMDILDNVIPFVGGDETKMENEPRKMLGTFNGRALDYLDVVTSATCTRVPVMDGHLVNIAMSLEEQPELGGILAAWDSFVGPEPVSSLPSAPERPLVYFAQQDRPQPRRDRMTGKGMATSLGRLREDPVLGYKFAALSHNTIRGAAGSSILNAELLAVSGYIEGFKPVAVMTDVTV